MDGEPRPERGSRKPWTRASKPCNPELRLGGFDMRLALLLGGAALITLGLSGPVSAQGGIRPECRSMGNPHACTCALNNGGQIKHDPGRSSGRQRWTWAKPGTAAHMAYMNCVNGSGR
jgi:hypothetical protein